jgi:beta-mannosidase
MIRFIPSLPGLKILLSQLILFSIFSATTAGQNPNSVSLSGKWKVAWNDGNKGPTDETSFIHYNPKFDSLKYVTVDVPGDLNLEMQKRGMFGDVNIGINTLAAGWVSRHYWQYYRYFNVPAQILNKTAWLVFDRLDYNATVFINGVEVGKHQNAFIPSRIDVSNKLKAGTNLITVGIESGLFCAADKDITSYNQELRTRLNKRVWLRKPAYQFGWDWNPNLINVGITGDVRLEWKETARIDQVVTFVKMSADLSSADLTVRPFIQGLSPDAEVAIQATILETGQKALRTTRLSKSTDPYELNMKVDKPKLWWPVGYGAPELYTVKVEIKANGIVIDSATRRTGFRKIEVDRSPHPVAGNYFIIKVNNQKIFMKGGDWVPADMIYGSVDKKRIEKLVDLALDANFNILRIWGGGEFAGNTLLDLCDEKGLVVWHDFLFACAKYPAENLNFHNAVKEEVTWAVREFSCHPSLIVWCGNNENELGTFAWGYTNSGKIVPDYILYHHLIPTIVKAENPGIFYWPSSPYSENYEDPNSPITGDQHPWSVSLGADDVNFYAYRNYVDRFPNEGGFLGASSPATLRQFLPKEEQYVRSVTWDHHDNLVNFWQGKDATYRTVEYWTGKTFQQLSFDDYAFASALLQAEALTEYISNYHRRMFSSSSAIFWMYNDSWPVTHGWTIVDYYSRKKLAYHPVRRAFAQQNVVIAEENDKINFYGINDSNKPWTGNLQYGLFKTTGGYTLNEAKKVTLPPNTSSVIASFDKSVYDKAGYTGHGAFAVLRKNEVPVSQYKLLLEKFKNLELEKPEIRIEYKDGYAVLSSPVFVWGVCLDLNGEDAVTDNCFDLIPGVPYYVKLNNGEKLSVRQTGNDLLLRPGK